MSRKRLETILQWVRPHRSSQEQAFVGWLVSEIRGLGYQPFIDAIGNVWVEHEGAKTLFTAHTDTCHSSQLTERTQEVKFDWDGESNGMARLVKQNTGYVLGADDGTGIWILLRMLEARVPGSYVFFRGEECGGIGSLWAAENRAEELVKYSHAVAFDRRSCSDIITHQGGTRCCSDTFAQALATGLNTDGVAFLAPCDSGIFTDTANLTHLIPECTNISVGYKNEHTCEEAQDLLFAQWLAAVVVQLDWASLPVKRDPSIIEPLFNSLDYPYWGHTPKPLCTDDDDVSTYLDQVAEDITKFGYDYAAEIVYGEPELAVQLLLEVYCDFSKGRLR